MIVKLNKHEGHQKKRNVAEKTRGRFGLARTLIWTPPPPPPPPTHHPHPLPQTQRHARKHKQTNKYNQAGRHTGTQTK